MKNEDIEKMSTEDLIQVLIERVQKDLSNKEKSTEELTKMHKQKFKDYLKGFDKEFQTHTQNIMKKTPLLLNFYREFVEMVYSPSETYDLAIKIKNNISADLTKDFTEKQKNLLEQIEYCEGIISDDSTEQAFIYGFAMASQMKEEAISQYPNTSKRNN